MATGLTILFTAIGLILFFTPYFLWGVGSFGLAVLSWRYHNTRDEERLVGVLAVIAFLSVVALVVEDLIGRFLLS